LKAAQHGIDLGPLEPRFDRVIATRDKKIGMLPNILRGDIVRLRDALNDTASSATDRLLLISQRTMNSMNSWLNNSPLLTAGRNRCVLTMHPSDAHSRGLVSGQDVEIASGVGAIVVTLNVSDGMMPGTIALPYGWDRSREGTGLSVAKQRGGASFNDVSDEKAFDRVSGTAVLDGIPVSVQAA
jgi:anaerobic selenocysteine-containing dehydrogenase